MDVPHIHWESENGPGNPRVFRILPSIPGSSKVFPGYFRIPLVIPGFTGISGCRTFPVFPGDLQSASPRRKKTRRDRRNDRTGNPERNTLYDRVQRTSTEKRDRARARSQTPGRGYKGPVPGQGVESIARLLIGLSGALNPLLPASG